LAGNKAAISSLVIAVKLARVFSAVVSLASNLLISLTTVLATPSPRVTLVEYTLEPSSPVRPILPAISPSAAVARVTSLVRACAEAMSFSPIAMLAGVEPLAGVKVRVTCPVVLAVAVVAAALILAWRAFVKSVSSIEPVTTDALITLLASILSWILVAFCSTVWSL